MGLKFSEVVTSVFLTTGVGRATGNSIVRFVEIQTFVWTIAVVLDNNG